MLEASYEVSQLTRCMYASMPHDELPLAAHTRLVLGCTEIQWLCFKLLRAKSEQHLSPCACKFVTSIATADGCKYSFGTNFVLY